MAAHLFPGHLRSTCLSLCKYANDAPQIDLNGPFYKLTLSHCTVKTETIFNLTVLTHHKHITHDMRCWKNSYLTDKASLHWNFKNKERIHELLLKPVNRVNSDIKHALGQMCLIIWRKHGWPSDVEHYDNHLSLLHHLSVHLSFSVIVSHLSFSGWWWGRTVLTAPPRPTGQEWVLYTPHLPLPQARGGLS